MLSALADSELHDDCPKVLLMEEGHQIIRAWAVALRQTLTTLRGLGLHSLGLDT